jgi:hypothetical protein
LSRLQAIGQRGELVTRQHQLLQSRALAQFGGQMADGVVRQGQPAQSWRQRGGRHMGNAVGLEADHVQCRAVAQHFGQRGVVVVRRKQYLQAVQARQLVRQISQSVAAQVEHL